MRYLLPFVLAAFLGGCSDDNKTITTADGEVTMQESDGNMAFERTVDGKTETVHVDDKANAVQVHSSDGTSFASAAKVPDNFPLKLSTDALLVTGMHSKQEGEETFLVQFYTPQPAATVATDYEQQLKGNNLTIEKVEQSVGGETIITLAGSTEEVQAAVQISNKGGHSEVVITWTKKDPEEADNGQS